MESPDSSAESEDRKLKKRDLDLKEREILIKEGELDLKRREALGASWRSPLVLSVIGATLAAAGNAGVSYLNAKQQRELDDRKSEQTRILEMIKTGDADKAAENLKFLVNTGLITDSGLIDRLNHFQRERKPGTGPALPTPSGNSIAERIALADQNVASSSSGRGARFHVLNHVLYGANNKPVSVVEAYSKGSGHLVATRAIVLHFSADSANGSVERFMGRTPDFTSGTSNSYAAGSVHLVIGRDGSVTQLVAFDVPANHAGLSHWNGLTSLNKYSIGIMFENRGRLSKVNGKWPLPDDQILVVKVGPNTEAWERYTPQQVEAAREVITALGAAYPSIEAVLRHSEISPGIKIDPGPALDTEPLTAALKTGKSLAQSNRALSESPAQ